ncbi:MAG TPA: class 1 fructose-bisphosphatase [Nitrososphaerales archaeon]|nr:class 1 fructose-bisphosphatase [Nitrososphaerales archaeon]
MVAKDEIPTIFLEGGLADLERDLSSVYAAIAKTAQVICRHLPFLLGTTQTLNPFGEKQAKLDVFSNEAFCKALLDTGHVGCVASEELERPLQRSVRNKDSLSIAMDPLDGSSNITTNNPLGSIFGVWKGALPKKGRDLVAAAFVTYGPTLTITLSSSRRVDQYVEIRDGMNSGRFALAYRGMKLPSKPEVYGIGGTRAEWIPQVERFARKLETRGMRLRYGGTFIGDYNQLLQRGGIFSYPEHKGKPGGKLRICYETAPMSFITELAGGASSDGSTSILDITPTSLAQTSPFYVGNSGLIRELEAEIAAG